MPKLNEIIQWQDSGSEFQLYVRHYYGKDDKVNINIVYEDVILDKVTEINIPHSKVKHFLKAVNGNLLSKKYEINI